MKKEQKKQQQVEKESLIQEEESFDSIRSQFWDGYDKDTPKKVKIMDAFCLYLFLIGCIEFLYFLIVGDFPRNALISGLFAPFGTMIITICLRMQVNPKTKYINQSDERSFWEYLICIFIFLLTCTNYIG